MYGSCDDADLGREIPRAGLAREVTHKESGPGSSVIAVQEKMGVSDAVCHRVDVAPLVRVCDELGRRDQQRGVCTSLVSDGGSDAAGLASAGDVSGVLSLADGDAEGHARTVRG